MKRINLIISTFFLLAVFSLLSCTSIKTTATWVNREKIPNEPYKNLFIMALTENLHAKTIIENDLAAVARKKGLVATTSIEAFGPIGLKNLLPIKDIVESKLKELACESIMFIALVDKQSETRYVPGPSVGIYAPYYNYGYYGNYGGYYGYATGYCAPGYYTTDKTYFLECNLYDVKTGEIIFSVQTKAENPGEIEKSSKEYLASLLTEIQKMGLFKKS